MKELKTLEIKVTALFGIFEDDHLAETIPMEVKITRLDADLFKQAHEVIAKKKQEAKQMLENKSGDD